jgi:hypothetical protein
VRLNRFGRALRFVVLLRPVLAVRLALRGRLLGDLAGVLEWLCATH